MSTTCEHCGKRIVEYGKSHIHHILMHRDNMSSEDAIALIRQTQQEIEDLMNNSEGFDHDTLEQIIENNFGLEPDFISAFIFE